MNSSSVFHKLAFYGTPKYPLMHLCQKISWSFDITFDRDLTCVKVSKDLTQSKGTFDMSQSHNSLDLCHTFDERQRRSIILLTKNQRQSLSQARYGKGLSKTAKTVFTTFDPGERSIVTQLS